jgi:hypothetical protein
VTFANDQHSRLIDSLYPRICAELINFGQQLSIIDIQSERFCSYRVRLVKRALIYRLSDSQDVRIIV